MDNPSTNVNLCRAALPEVMFVPDIALALRCGPSTARTALRAGACGPTIRLGRRIAVLRESFLDALRDRARPGSPLRALRDEVQSASRETRRTTVDAATPRPVSARAVAGEEVQRG